jgi:hypothetical protein
MAKEEKSFLNLNVEGEAARTKSFEPLADCNNMCCGSLAKVEVVMTEVPITNKKGDTSTWEYAGNTIPSLVFHFVNYIGPNTDPQGVNRSFKYRESIIGSVNKKGEAVSDESLTGLYESMWNRIKHILDVFSKECKVDITKDKELTQAIKVISGSDIVKGSDKQKRIDAFKGLFDAVANLLNTGFNGKPMFMRGEKSPIILYMKLLADYSTHRFLTFPTFVGDGFMEICKVTDKGLRINQTSMKIKSDESIVLKGVNKGTMNSAGGVNQEVKNPEITDPELRQALGLAPIAVV